MIGIPFLIGIGVGEIIEIKAFHQNLLFGNPGGIISIGQQSLQNPPVFLKGIVNVPDHIVTIGLDLVIIVVPTIIITKLLIRPSLDGLIAIQAGFSFQLHINKLCDRHNEYMQ